MKRELALRTLTILFIATAVLSGLSACAVGASSPTPRIPTSPSLPIFLTPMPSFTPVPTTTPGCIPGLVESASLATTRLQEPLHFSVYLPPCYAKQDEARYPVLYLLHGQTYTEDQWTRLGALEFTDQLVASGEIPPFIIVMPYDKSWKQPTEDAFGDVLTDELVPYMDEHYRTLPDRAHRAIGGLSRGGGWAIHIGLTRADLFAAFGAHSPAIFRTDANDLAGWLKAIPSENLPRIYLDTGDNDRELRSILDFEDLLTQNNFPHEWHLFTGFHEEKYWQAHLEEYLRWYAAGW